MQKPQPVAATILHPPAINIRTQFHVHDLRFEVVFREIQSIFYENGIELILLKGPHLAHAVYEHPHERPYGDQDLLVKPKEFKKAAELLKENGYELILEDERNLATLAQTNHWGFRSRYGQLIELHRGFTGMNRHPVEIDVWFARAVSFTYGQTPAKGLANEDLLCHLCLHIGKSFFYFIEKKHIRDLDEIIKKSPIEWNLFLSNCRKTKSKAIAYYCLQAAKSQYGTQVPNEVFAALKPKGWRQKWLNRHLDTVVFPIYRFYSRGMEHARKRLTLPLLDGIFSWIPFLARAGAVKGLDVVLRVPVFGKGWKKRRARGKG